MSTEEPERVASQRDQRRRDGLLTTGEMARLTQSTLRTVRFYEEAGLLEPVQRTHGGHRLYRRCDLDKLRLVTGLRLAGFSLEEIRDLLAAKERGPDAVGAARALASRLDQHVRDLSERAQLLQRLAAELSEARRALGDCTTCARPDLFPSHCSDCEVMNRGGGPAPAVGVLWGVGR